MITTTGIYHIGIPVNDVERAVKFYTEVLGMKVAKLNRDDMGDHLNRADLESETTWSSSFATYADRKIL